MKARIEKKLSKRIAEILPYKFYGNAWACNDEPSELAYEQGTAVSGVLYIGGGVNYWGEGEDAYTVLEDFIMHFDFHEPIYNPYPKGHELEHYPQPTGKRPTGKYLINCAKLIAQHQK